MHEQRKELTDSKWGVSIVVCCHNSAMRLYKTLSHLNSQKVPVGFPWEVIVVDNASTDDTDQVARSSWPLQTKVPLRIVQEPRLGLSNARKKDIQSASYQLVSFVDDDNWLAPDWVSTAAKIMSDHPEVGACGKIKVAFSSISPAI